MSELPKSELARWGPLPFPDAACRSLRVIILVCVLQLSGMCYRATAMESGSLEEEMVAAFLLRFAAYTTWPDIETEEDPLYFGIPEEYGRDVFQAMETHRVKQHQVNVVFYRDEIPSGLHVLLVRHEVVAPPPSVLGLPILTVGFAESFCREGGVLRLFMKAGRPAFQASMLSCERSGIRLSARMLGLADHVERR